MGTQDMGCGPEGRMTVACHLAMVPGNSCSVESEESKGSRRQPSSRSLLLGSEGQALLSIPRGHLLFVYFNLLTLVIRALFMFLKNRAIKVRGCGGPLSHMIDSQAGKEQHVPSKPFVSKSKLCKANWKREGSLTYNQPISIAGGKHQ